MRANCKRSAKYPNFTNYVQTQNAHRKFRSRQAFGNPSPLSGLQAAVTRRGACHANPDATAPGAQRRVCTQTYCTCYPDYMPSEKSENSATEDHGFMCSIHCPSPTLDSFDVLYRSNKETFTTRPYAIHKQEECITFMMRRNKIMWASFRQ